MIVKIDTFIFQHTFILILKLGRFHEIMQIINLTLLFVFIIQSYGMHLDKYR